MDGNRKHWQAAVFLKPELWTECKHDIELFHVAIVQNGQTHSVYYSQTVVSGNYTATSREFSAEGNDKTDGHRLQ